MATLTIADERVAELQDALLVALTLKRRVQRLSRDLARLDEVIDRVCKSIYNATVYDPMGEEASDDA